MPKLGISKDFLNYLVQLERIVFGSLADYMFFLRLRLDACHVDLLILYDLIICGLEADARVV